MELFSARICPFAERTRLVLVEKGIEHEHVEIDLSDKPQRFLDVSPYGKVPAIVHNGEALFESAIINEYLDEVVPEPRLMPEDPVARARTRIWIHYCDDKFLSDYYALLQNQDASLHQQFKDKVLDHLRTIETEGLAKQSESGPFWFGTEPTLVDFAYFPFFERLPAWSHYRGVSIPDECPRLKRWVAAMWMRDSVREVANAPDYYVEHYKGYARDVMAA
jgi:glutathione S-transferase